MKIPQSDYLAIQLYITRGLRKMNGSRLKSMLPSSLLYLLLVIVGLPGMALAQRDSTQGTYCNIFYMTSSNEAMLPFTDKCFLTDEYSVLDPTNMRAVGPIESSLSLFDRHPWLIHFYLPVVRPSDRLQVQMPIDFYSKSLKMGVGKFFVTISDNRSSSRLDPVLDNVDFVAVSGSARVLDYEDAKPGQPFASYSIQMDMQFRQVDRSEGSPKLVGDPIKVKMHMMLEPKE